MYVIHTKSKYLHCSWIKQRIEDFFLKDIEDKKGNPGSFIRTWIPFNQRLNHCTI